MLLNQVYNPESYELEANVFGFGGKISKNQSISLPTIPEAQLFHYYQEAVKSICSLGYKGIIIHLDNLEFFNKESIYQIKKVFEAIRDILQIRHVYYIFVAQLGFFQQVISPSQRVRSVFLGWPIIIRPLTKKETLEAIHLRYKLLEISKMNFIKPIEDSFIEYLYNVYDGQLRFIMDALNTIILHIPSTKITTLSEQDAKPLFKRIVSERMQHTLAPKELEILMMAAKLGTFTNSDISEHTHMQKQNVNKYLQTLIEKTYIRFWEKQGRKSIYHISEDAKALKIFSETLSSKEKQEKQDVDSLNKRQRQFIAECEEMNVEQYSNYMNISIVTARRDLRGMEAMKMVKSYKKNRIIFYQKLP